MERRAAAAEVTRQRIVTATLELHGEKGVLATSHKDIAARADVSVGTVYYHFPDQDSIVRACGAHVRVLFPPPPPEAIDPRAPRSERVAALARALVELYARMPWIEKLRAERHDLPTLDAGISMREEAVRRLIRRALGRGAGRKTIAVVQALLDPAVVNRLLESGRKQREAAATLASVLNRWLEGGHS